MGNIGARDYIDQLLVEKYANEKMDNHTMAASAVPPEKMLEVMQDYATVHCTMLNLKNKLNKICDRVTAASAYKS